jgi:glucosamine--fructose-6-phosphate aminotransferase (isomerizing)
MPEGTDYAIYEEISNQGEAWERLIRQIIPRAEAVRELFDGVEEVIFSGCGSGLNAALSASPTFQAKTGISARAVPAADVYQFPETALLKDRDTVAVLLSRSGKTTEVVRALDVFHQHGMRALGVTCTASSPLGTGSDLAFILQPVAEQAVATTRSLTGMILTTQLVAAMVSIDGAYVGELQRLPQVCRDQIERFRALGQEIGQRVDVQRYAFVGSGPFFGAVRESQLKVKEMVLLPADAYPVLDFRHGPQSNVDQDMLVTAFLSDSGYQEEVQFLQDIKDLGGVIWAVCERASGEVRAAADYVLELKSGLSEWARAPLCMPAVQYMAYYRALTRGLNPDRPKNLSYWVNTSK